MKEFERAYKRPWFAIVIDFIGSQAAADIVCERYLRCCVHYNSITTHFICLRRGAKRRSCSSSRSSSRRWQIVAKGALNYSIILLLYNYIITITYNLKRRERDLLNRVCSYWLIYGVIIQRCTWVSHCGTGHRWRCLHSWSAEYASSYESSPAAVED